MNTQDGAALSEAVWLLRGILALLAIEREEVTSREPASPELRAKPEIVLAKAGLTAPQIASVMGKKANSVAKTISRAKD